MRWQKTARLIIAVFIVVFAGIVFVALRKPRPAPAPEEALKIDDKALIQTSGGVDFKNFDKDGKIVFAIKAAKQRIYDGGRQVFEQAVLTLPDRNGRTIEIAGDEAETVTPEGANEPSIAIVKGHTKVTTSDNLTITADEANYESKEGIVKVPGPVAFTKGRLTGHGVGATYDRIRDVLWLLDQAQVSVAPDEHGAGKLEATSGTAGLARADHYIRMSKAAHVVSDNRTIDTDDLTATLTPDDQRVQMMQLRGSSRITGTGAGAQSMSAKDIDLTYGPDGRSLQSAKLMEQSVLQLPADNGSGGRKISARMIDMALAPDGTTVTQLNATEGVVVDLPAQGDMPAKTIKSSTLSASGAGGAGLQTATFEGPVDYRETRAARGGAAAVDRHATARRLIVQTKPGFGDLQQAEFRGSVKFTDGTETTAESQRAVYQVDKDRLDLSPSQGDPGPAPTVSDGQMTINARTIEMTMSTRVMKGDTDVRTRWQRKPAAGRGDAAARGGDPQAKGGDATKLPSMLKQDEPVTITANRLDYDGAASRAKYMGNARLTQIDTEVRADTIELDDQNGNLTAHGNVRTKMTMDDVDPKTKQRKSAVTNGNGETFVYEDAKRVATYTSGPSARAHIVGPQGDVTGDRIDLFLKEGGNELERAEAEGNVTTIESNRTAKGQHLTYRSATEDYVMTGAPVDVLERSDNNSCKRTLASILRFRRAVDTIQTEGIPVTTTQVACPATQD